jgi:hypothetical protein
MSQGKNELAEICYRKIKIVENNIAYQLDKIREASNSISYHNKKLDNWKDSANKLIEENYNHFIIDSDFSTYIIKLDDVELKRDDHYHFTGVIGVFSNSDNPKFNKTLCLKLSDIRSITPITAEQFKDLIFEAILEDNRDVLKNLKD